MSERVLSKVQFFHGTSAEFEEGDEIQPSSVSGRQTFKKPHFAYDPNKVYVTTSRGQAASYAESAVLRHGGEERVYEVEPHEDIEPDPETAGMGGGWDVSHRASSARVLRRVED